MKLHFLYGSETGNSEMVCEDVRDALDGQFECEISNLGEIDPSAMDPEPLYMIITSTYGNGDLPSTAAPFLDAFETVTPDLSKIRFAIFGLGDMVFSETFNHGSLRVMEKLIECGATMLGERAEYDSSSGEMPEDMAIPWAKDILDNLNAKAA